MKMTFRATPVTCPNPRVCHLFTPVNKGWRQGDMLYPYNGIVVVEIIIQELDRARHRVTSKIPNWRYEK